MELFTIQIEIISSTNLTPSAVSNISNVKKHQIMKCGPIHKDVSEDEIETYICNYLRFFIDCPTIGNDLLLNLLDKRNITFDISDNSDNSQEVSQLLDFVTKYQDTQVRLYKIISPLQKNMRELIQQKLKYMNANQHTNNNTNKEDKYLKDIDFKLSTLSDQIYFSFFKESISIFRTLVSIFIIVNIITTLIISIIVIILLGFKH